MSVHLRARTGYSIAALAALLLAACGGGGVSDSVTPPPPPRDTTGTVPVVQRTTLTVEVGVDPPDSALARSAGITGSGVLVRILRIGAGNVAQEQSAGADGRVTFTQLLEGQYEVSAVRTLTAAEQQRLPEQDRDITILAAGANTAVTPPTPRSVRIELVASRRGALVISERYSYHPVLGGLFYNYADYTEVMNVSDTTIYLDGILLVRSLASQHAGTPESQYCADFSALRLDASALWVNSIYRFPGSGREFPLAPGAAAVWAMDAINHAAVAPGTPDLSRARFEEIGSPGDVDNPAAAKMVRLSRNSDVATHGFPMAPSRITALVAPIARDTLGLERRIVYSGTIEVPVWRIPRETILDMASIVSTPERYSGTSIYREGGFRYCDPWITPAHDRAMAQLYDETQNRALRRRGLGTTATGIPILMRTRTSARDFETADPLRRSLNK